MSSHEQFNIIKVVRNIFHNLIKIVIGCFFAVTDWRSIAFFSSTLVSFFQIGAADNLETKLISYGFCSLMSVSYVLKSVVSTTLQGADDSWCLLTGFC